MKKHIVMIEDDEDIQFIVTHLLVLEGYIVSSADTSVHVQSIALLKPDLIILDEWQFSRYGNVICNDLKQSPVTANIPLLLLSTLPSFASIAEECPADSFMALPLDIDELLHEVKRILE